MWAASNPKHGGAHLVYSMLWDTVLLKTLPTTSGAHFVTLACVPVPAA